jgi:hypothetical protein
MPSIRRNSYCSSGSLCCFTKSTEMNRRLVLGVSAELARARLRFNLSIVPETRCLLQKLLLIKKNAV